MRAAVAIILLVVLAIAAPVGANRFVEMPGEFRVAIPDGWIVSGEVTSYPVEISHEALAAHMSIFRTELTDNEQLYSEAAFRASVSGIIDSVVLQLPDAVLLTSTGYNEGRRAVFIVEFSSVEPGTDILLEHYLVGILYRHPDGYQVMFSLWGRASQSLYASVKADFEQMQAGFSYTGPAEDDVFAGGTSSNRWLLLLLAGLLAALFWVRRRRSQITKTTTGTVPIWRCTCGRANHIDNTVCRRCGEPRPDRLS